MENKNLEDQPKQMGVVKIILLSLAGCVAAWFIAPIIVEFLTRLFELLVTLTGWLIVVGFVMCVFRVLGSGSKPAKTATGGRRRR